MGALAGAPARAQELGGAPPIVPREARAADQCGAPRADAATGRATGIVHHTINANDYRPQDSAAMLAGRAFTSSGSIRPPRADLDAVLARKAPTARVTPSADGAEGRLRWVPALSGVRRPALYRLRAATRATSPAARAA
jgi:hypothetical protein